MNISCQRPYALYAILLIIPAIIASFLHYRKVSGNMHRFTIKNDFSVAAKRMKSFRSISVMRSLFACLAWIMLVCAYAGLSWGTYLEPVQKNGTSVSLVFDISYSMMADDASSGLSRLEAAKKYSRLLLSHAQESSVSVILAKGDGVTVIPVTEDRAAVENTIEALSPKMMSSTGTSLGKGVRAALKAFPEQSARKNVIWLFTDGEETDGLLEGALSDCVKAGVSVYIIGFGSERESKVLAGDGKTFVYTALRSEKMKKVCQSVMKKYVSGAENSVKVAFVDSTESGSAFLVLESLSSALAFGGSKTSNSSFNSDTAYEIKPVQRYVLFVGLGILFLVLLFVTTELDVENISGRFKSKTATLIVFCSVLTSFTSCKVSPRVEGAKSVLESTWAWYQQKYNKATAGFLHTVYLGQKEQDLLLEQYGSYNLAVTYMSRNENDSAELRLLEMDDAALPDSVRYGRYYNLGVLAHRKGDYETSAAYFREALKVCGNKKDAKINLELSIMKAEKAARSKESGFAGASDSEEHSTMEQAVFERIREYDKQQWKNSEKSEKSNSAQDY